MSSPGMTVATLGVGLFGLMDEITRALSKPTWAAPEYEWFANKFNQLQAQVNDIVQCHNDNVQMYNDQRAESDRIHAESLRVWEESGALHDENHKLKRLYASSQREALGRTQIMHRAAWAADRAIEAMIEAQVHGVDALMANAAYLMTLPRYLAKLGLSEKQAYQARAFAAKALVPESDRMAHTLEDYIVGLIADGFAAGYEINLVIQTDTSSRPLLRARKKANPDDGEPIQVMSGAFCVAAANAGSRPTRLVLKLEGGPYPIQTSLTLSSAAQRLTEGMMGVPADAPAPMQLSDKHRNQHNVLLSSQAIDRLDQFVLATDEHERAVAAEENAPEGAGVVAGYLYESLLRAPVADGGTTDIRPFIHDNPLVKASMDRLGIEPNINHPENAAVSYSELYDSIQGPPEWTAVECFTVGLKHTDPDLYGNLVDSPVEHYRKVRDALFTVLEVYSPNLQEPDRPRLSHDDLQATLHKLAPYVQKALEAAATDLEFADSAERKAWSSKEAVNRILAAAFEGNEAVID